MVSADLRNRHPADALYDIRAQLKALEEQEAALRAYLLDHPENLEGSEYVAIIKNQSRRHVDLESLAAEVGVEVLDRFTSHRPFKVVGLEDRISEMEE